MERSITLSKDGNKWCARIGADLMLGEAGFGDDPIAALIDLRSKLPSETIEVSSEILEIPSTRQQVTDGYHSFDELYRHRYLLFALAARVGDWGNGDRKLKGWKSWKHHDNSPMYEGYFIAGLELPTGQISYHIPAEYWALIQLPQYDRAPEWDGHSSEDVLQRIADRVKGERS